jgi:error-prone DNA polymerase
MLACRGRVQREGEVIHLVAEELVDLSDLLRSVGQRETAGLVPHGCGDDAVHAGDIEAQEGASIPKLRSIHVPALQPTGGIKVPTRDFR